MAGAAGGGRQGTGPASSPPPQGSPPAPPPPPSCRGWPPSGRPATLQQEVAENGIHNRVVGGNGIQNRGWWEEMAFRTGGGGRKWHSELGVVGGNGIQNWGWWEEMAFRTEWWEEMAFRTGGGGRKWHLGQRGGRKWHSELGVVGGNGIQNWGWWEEMAFRTEWFMKQHQNNPNDYSQLPVTEKEISVR